MALVVFWTKELSPQPDLQALHMQVLFWSPPSGPGPELCTVLPAHKHVSVQPEAPPAPQDCRGHCHLRAEPAQVLTGSLQGSQAGRAVAALLWAMPALCPEPGRQAACGQSGKWFPCPSPTPDRDGALPPEQGVWGTQCFLPPECQARPKRLEGCGVLARLVPRESGPVLRLCSLAGLLLLEHSFGL